MPIDNNNPVEMLKNLETEIPYATSDYIQPVEHNSTSATPKWDSFTYATTTSTEFDNGFSVEASVLPCEDGAEMLCMTIHKFEWDKTFNCSFDIMDSYTKNYVNRFKRAWHALTDTPLYYTGIYVDNIDRAEKFLKECLAKIEEIKKEYKHKG